MIENVEKRDISSFFPKDWTPAQVEKAILEAYENRQPTPQSHVFTGFSAEGVQIEMWLDRKGQLMTAYPRYGRGR